MPNYAHRAGVVGYFFFSIPYKSVLTMTCQNCLFFGGFSSANFTALLIQDLADLFVLFLAFFDFFSENKGSISDKILCFPLQILRILTWHPLLQLVGPGWESAPWSPHTDWRTRSCPTRKTSSSPPKCVHWTGQLAFLLLACRVKLGKASNVKSHEKTNYKNS